MNVPRRPALGLALGLVVSLAAGARAQGRRATTVLVPSTEGGATDFIARMLAHALADRLGQPFEVVDVPGRSGITGTSMAARARPDGHTLLVSSNSTFVTAAELFTDLPYNNDTDLQPLGLLASTGLALCVRSDSGFTSVAELLQAAKQAGPPVRFSSSGFGAITHLAMELLLHRADASMAHHACPSGSPAIRLMLSGGVEACFSDATVALPFMQSGAVRALAVSSALRLAQMPQVPTLDESGFPGFQASAEFALFAPAGIPADHRRLLVAAMREVMTTTMMRRRLAVVAMTPVGTGPEEFGTYLEHERAQWRAMLREHPVVPQPSDC